MNEAPGAFSEFRKIRVIKHSTDTGHRAHASWVVFVSRGRHPKDGRPPRQAPAFRSTLNSTFPRTSAHVVFTQRKRRAEKGKL